MAPEISQECYNFIHSIIERETSVPAGFDVPDFYFIKQIVFVDKTKIKAYRPFIALKFGDNYRDDMYKTILVSPIYQTITLGE